MAGGLWSLKTIMHYGIKCQTCCMQRHEAELLTTNLLMLSAIGCGLILKFVRQPPLVGYTLAGLFIGPSGLGLIDYSTEISSLAELCIILLLFIIGIEFSVKEFLSVVRSKIHPLGQPTKLSNVRG